MLVCGHVWWAVWIGLDHGRVCVGLSGLGWTVACLSGVVWIGLACGCVCGGLSGSDWTMGVSISEGLSGSGWTVDMSVVDCLN